MTPSAPNPVTLSIEGTIAVVTIANPPVNALSQAVRAGLVAAAERIDGDAAISAAVLICDGRTFIAGADIAEFGKPPLEPLLPAVVDRLEASTKPWIAAIHGTALGGGLEVALGCHYRIAEPKARLGFPEVNLGLIPGAGGTVRLPRLVAPDQAVTMITGGKPVPAEQALAWGLLDRLAAAGLRESGLAFAAEVAGQAPPLPLSKRPPVGQLAPAAWEESIAGLRKKARGQLSPIAAAEALRESLTLPAEQAFVGERRRFVELRDGGQSKALRYIFFAEKAVGKVPEIRDVAPRPLDRIGVVGGGTMGAGIAAAVLLADRQVMLIERDDAALDKGLTTVRGHLDGSLERGLIGPAKHQRLLAKLAGSTAYDALGDADLVIEAVFEDLDVKTEVFATLDAITRPDAVLASNTSYLDMNAIARSVKQPSRVIGLHFFSPAHVMKLLEIIRTDYVAADVLATGFTLAGLLRKTAVLAGVCDGFIGNRIMSAYRRQCEYMLEDGALPQEIDAAMVGFGFPMGLFAVQDLSGLDIAWAMRKRQAVTRDPAARYVAVGDRLCELGRFGRKAGAGWYRYAEGAAKGEIDPLVEAIILEESAKKGIDRRGFTADEIVERIVGTMQAEGEKILAQAIAASPEAIDVVMVNGYGFPRWRGGPMFMKSQA